MEDPKKDHIDFQNDDYIEGPGWHFSITPRTALRFLTGHDFSSDPSYLETTEEPMYWTNGITASITSPWLPNTSLLVTGLYGEENSHATAIATQPIPGVTGANLAFPVKMKYDSQLLDFEILARTEISDTNAYWLAGFQYIGLDTDFTITSGAPIFNGKTKRNQTSDTYLGKIGLGGYFNLSENGRHRIFSNVMLAAGFLDQNTGITPSEAWVGFGGDINVGYQWIINDSVSISPRYRAQIIYWDTENKTVEDQTFVFHGPELHFTYRFQ